MNQQSFFNKLFERQIGAFCIILLLCTILFILYPITPSTAEAVDCQPGDPEPCATAHASEQVAINIASTVSIALQNSLSIDVIPRGNGSFVSNSSSFVVATNNPTGYSIHMQAEKSTGGVANLESSDSTNDRVIQPVTGKVTESGFGDNTWGYSLDGTNYQAVPATTSIIHEADSTSYHDRYDLEFGVKVTTDIPAGQYTNGVIISVVANPREIKTLTEATYLQDFDGTRTATSTICAQSKVGDTKQLIDTRDSKKYWVTKLADENCWMTQNLALDLSTSKPLTSADSDVTNNWTPAYSTSKANDFGAGGAADTGRSWNVGEYVLATPTRAIACSQLSAGQSLSKCGDYEDVAGLLPTMTGVVEGSWKDYYTGPLAVNLDNGTYNSHYLIGNYYQWSTATAGATTTSSICPKGWKLPNTQQIAAQLAAYGITDKLIGTKQDESGNFYNIALAPLTYVRAGAVEPTGNGILYTLGTTGSYWSSTPSATNAAYFLVLDATGVNSAAYRTRMAGFSIRCVAR